MSAAIFFSEGQPPKHAAKVYDLVVRQKAVVSVDPLWNFEVIQKMARQDYHFDLEFVDALARTKRHGWSSTSDHVVFNGNCNTESIMRLITTVIGPCIMVKLPVGLGTPENRLQIPAFFRKEDYALWKLMSANLLKMPIIPHHDLYWRFGDRFNFDNAPGISFIQPGTLSEEWDVE